MENLTAKNSFTILIPKHLMLQPSLSTSIIQASWDPNNNHSNFSPYCGERVGNSLLTRGGLQGLVKMSSLSVGVKGVTEPLKDVTVSISYKET